MPEERSGIGPYEALVDTGADGTFVPTGFIEQLEAPVLYATNVRSHLGDRIRRVSIHKVDILFGDTRLPDMEVVSDDFGDEVILGRNVLNKLLLLPDGPMQATELT